MQFKINLTPYPGVHYFTVREHLRRFEVKRPLEVDMKVVEQNLRKLFQISSTYKFGVIHSTEKQLLLKTCQSILPKDNPISGQNNLATKPLQAHGINLLDLSYSFPQVGDSEWESFDILAIDPNASLGIPNEFLFLFQRDNSIGLNTAGEQKRLDLNNKDWNVLSSVLDDLDEKGMEMHVRESNYKAAVLYQMIESSKHLFPVSARESRSESMIVAECETGLFYQIQKLGYELFSHEHDGKTWITIANYPAHSKELIELFADRVSAV